MNTDVCDTLKEIMDNVNGTWKENVLLDNNTDNPLVDAYNQGAEAMAAQVMFYLQLRLNVLTHIDMKFDIGGNK